MPARYVQPLRLLIQVSFLGFMVWLGMRFYLFVDSLRSGGSVTIADRPAGIEGFLPISGLLGLTSWLKGYGFTAVHPAAVVILLTVLALSLLLRRCFCSWICPVAALSEWSWKAGFRIMKRNLRLPRWLDAVLRGVKYLFLIFFVWSICIAMPDGALLAFINSDYHKLADIRLLDFFLQISPGTLLFLMVLLAISLVVRNPFCRYLCPYGALLGLAALLSPVHVTRDTGRCVSCGVCSQVCPTSIDVMHVKRVTSPECIGCWRCVSHCRFNEALSMKFAGRYALSGFLFALLVVLLFWGGSQVGKASGHWVTSTGISEYRRLLK